LINLNYVFKILLISILFSTYSQALKITNLSQAVNISGKQRMFTQRMLKDYAMVGMGNTFSKPKDDLKNIITSFENNSNELESFTKDKATKSSLKQMKEIWSPIKEELNKTPSTKSAKKLQENLENLLKKADDTTKLFAKQTGKDSGEIINISGRQRMLSQKMASLYLLKVWGIDDPNFKEKMKNSMELFKTSLNKLIKYEKNTSKTSTLLKKVKSSFMFFEIMNKSKSKFIPSLIYKKSDDILKNMDTVTGIYAKNENN